MSSTTARPAASTGTRDIALIAAFAALIAVFGVFPKFPVAGSSVPIVIQNVAIMLTGCVLGARRGFLATLVFVVLALVGLPLLSGGRGGIGLLAGASAGYIISYPFMAGLIGLVAERRAPRPPLWWLICANVLGGIVLCYAFGVVGMMVNLHLSLHAAITANYPFIPGDLVKAVLAAAVAVAVHRSVPGLLARR